MIRPLVVVRPEPGLSETLIGARDRGLNAIAAPLFTIEPVAWDAPDAGAFDGLLIGSANAVRHGGAGLHRLSALPVHAVGERTAAAAREAGFRVASVGSGGLQQLLGSLSGPLRLLRLAGEERAALEPPPNLEIEDRVVYRACALDLAEPAIDVLRAGAVAVLHSGAAARRLAEECERLAIDRRAVLLAALAPGIADAAGPGWRSVSVGATISDPALLALAADLCQEPGGSAADEDRN